ncbi:MAG: diaminopimelate epimerase [Thermoguttaceae bacterium]
MRFTKMHGAGNDYVYVDCFHETVPADLADTARRISDRHFGVGGDGLVLICPSDTADARMRMFNADGSEAEMCGNAVRCVAKYVYEHGIAPKDSLRIETGAGVLTLELTVESGRVDRVQVDMGRPILEGERIPTTWSGSEVVDQPLLVEGREFRVTCVSMGNPHCVTYVEALSDELVLGVGPRIEPDPHFPRRVNVEFVEVLSPREIRMRVWERGSGETLACGTGASAACVAGVLSGRGERQITAHLTGGDLQLNWAENGHLYMTGPATEVFSGDWPDSRK